MKYYLFWATVLFSCLSPGCSIRDDFAPVADCTPVPGDSSASHPQAAVFQGILTEFTLEKGLPGIAALVFTPEHGVWMGAAGFSQVENNLPMAPCHRFMSASVAKMYHAVLALEMQEQGMLSIDDKIDKYLPGELIEKLPNGRTATIRHLLNHSSGIPNPTSRLSFLTSYINDFKRPIATETYLSYVFGKAPLAGVGEEFNYSDGNYLLLAMIIDRIYGDHARAMSELVIEPLGLSNTFYRNEASYKNRAELVNSYADLYDELVLRNVSEEERTFNESNIGHDGFKFTVHDGYLFLRKLFIEKALLTPESLDLMLNNDANLVSFSENERALLGAFLLADDPQVVSISHEGQTIGSSAYFGYYPKQQGILIVFSNFGGAVSNRLYEAMFLRSGPERCLLQRLEEAAF
jgi:D-alanyl-D-alanine carboxypeptidase